MGDLAGSLFKAFAHFHLEAHFLDQIGGQMKCLRLALEHTREEKLAMEPFAIGAAAVGLAALTAAFDKRTGQHLAQRAQSTNEPAAQVEFGAGWHLPLIILSELAGVKPLRRFAEMTGRVGVSDIEVRDSCKYRPIEIRQPHRSCAPDFQIAAKQKSSSAPVVLYSP